MLLLNVLLALAWVALTGQFTPTNLAFGFVLGYVMLWVAKRTEKRQGYFGKVWQVVSFAAFFLWEMIKANLQVTYYILAPHRKMRPGVIAVPLDVRTDIEITLLANLITLTPGTLSLDVSADRRVMYIHSMTLGDETDKFRRQIKEGFERRVLEVLR
ncbi:MAG: Na+/H+ antiporter subunit E [Chloroflexi bacterium]|nr:Na+/H+ antiporter subunit E [Chloroflexota bacterium]